MVNLKKIFTNVLNTHAPIKTKMIRFNNNVFMTKRITKRNYEKIKTKKQT